MTSDLLDGRIINVTYKRCYAGEPISPPHLFGQRLESRNHQPRLATSPNAQHLGLKTPPRAQAPKPLTAPANNTKPTAHKGDGSTYKANETSEAELIILTLEPESFITAANFNPYHDIIGRFTTAALNALRGQRATVDSQQSSSKNSQDKSKKKTKKPRPVSVENSPENKSRRKSIANIAASYNGDQRWRVDVQKEGFGVGAFKCNKFVGDVVKEAGAPILTELPDGSKRPSTAGEMANKHGEIDNWRVLRDDEQPQAGDIVAIPKNDGQNGRRYTGHAGIITENGIISAHDDGVYEKPGEFDKSKVPGVVYRRYTGK